MKTCTSLLTVSFLITSVILHAFSVDTCAQERDAEIPAAQGIVSHHPRFDLEQWLKLYPYEAFEHPERDRHYHFPPTPPDDPLDRRKPSGVIVTRPADICCVEQVRRKVARKHDLGEPEAVDVFLWSTKLPIQPYLTKLGGVPHREADKPWPRNQNGKPYTFVAQFCFLDSKDISPENLPDDVLLVFFENDHSHWGLKESDLHLEWSSRNLNNPVSEKDIPAPSFTVPQLSGAILRYQEYPESLEAFDREGHDQPYRFPVTQSTKIGPMTFFVQGDRRQKKDAPRLLCALNSLGLAYRRPQEWPFVDLKQLPEDARKRRDYSNWGQWRMMFADVGCMYFFLSRDGEVTAYGDSH